MIEDFAVSGARSGRIATLIIRAISDVRANNSWRSDFRIGSSLRTVLRNGVGHPGSITS